MNPPSDPGIAERYRKILERMDQAVRKRPSHFTQPVTWVAVSKTQPVEAIESLYRLGHRDFGENYAQELIAKAQELQARGCEGIRWHMIGHLQTNKVKALLPWVFSIHSVDSEKLALEIQKRWQALGKEGRFPIFVETNIDEEATKSGVLPEQVPTLLLRMRELEDLEVLGLMAIPNPESGEVRRAFQKLRHLSESHRDLTQGLLSMGMTQDFETAIEEGATHVRIGTAIFGARPTPR